MGQLFYSRYYGHPHFLLFLIYVVQKESWDNSGAKGPGGLMSPTAYGRVSHEISGWSVWLSSWSKNSHHTLFDYLSTVYGCKRLKDAYNMSKNQIKIHFVCRPVFL